MAPPPSWQLRIEAAEAALNLLNEFGIDQTRPIDVFGLCEQAGLWLAFVELDNALGAYVPEGVGGVLITTQRPLPIQRYTAAHELGHWRLEHGVKTDRQQEVLGTPPAEIERLAQIFASNLLMPPPLVSAIIGRVRPTATAAITGQHCYTLAREAGVSYEAAIRQLANLSVVTPQHANELLKLKKLAIKTELGFGRRPVSGWADVWPVDEQWHDQILHVHVEDEVAISLPENRSSGYRWLLADAPRQLQPSPEPPPFAPPTTSETTDPNLFVEAVEAAKLAPPTMPAQVRTRLRARPPTAEVVETDTDPGDTIEVDLVGDQYLSARGPLTTPTQARNARLELVDQRQTARGPDAAHRGNVRAGSTGRRLLGVRFSSPGVHTIRLEYRSPYSETPPLQSYAIHAVIETRRTAISIDQLTDDADAWQDEVRARQQTAPPPPLPTETAIDES